MWHGAMNEICRKTTTKTVSVRKPGASVEEEVQELRAIVAQVKADNENAEKESMFSSAM